MSDFSNHHEVKRTRKPHSCAHCSRRIEAGSRASVYAGSYGGDFYSDYGHPECEAAAMELADMNDAWGEEFPRLYEIDDADAHRWLLDKHPEAAASVGSAEWLARHEERKVAA